MGEIRNRIKKNYFFKEVVIINRTTKLIIAIIIALLLLICCISIDYSINPKSNITYNNTTIKNHDMVKINETYYVGMNKTGKAVKNETVKVESDLPIVSITAKPSCGCNYRNPGKYKYKWYKTSFINHCPKCGKWGTLRNVYKPTAKYEYELTCDMRLGGCDADYCGVCGKDKFSWSHYYITLAE